MHTVTCENIRRDLTEITNQVRFHKKWCLMLKNNKPHVGIVPVEVIHLLAAIFEKSKTSQEVSDIVKQYSLLLDDEDWSSIQSLLKAPPKPNQALKNAADSARKQIEFRDVQG